MGHADRRVRHAGHAQVKPALVQHCYELERRAAAPIESGVTPAKKSNLYESKFDFFKSDLPEVQALRQFCGEALSRTVFHLLSSAPPPARSRPGRSAWTCSSRGCT